MLRLAGPPAIDDVVIAMFMPFQSAAGLATCGSGEAMRSTATLLSGPLYAGVNVCARASLPFQLPSSTFVCAWSGFSTRAAANADPAVSISTAATDAAAVMSLLRTSSPP